MFHEFDEKVKLEAGLLFGDINELRVVLRDFVIQDGLEIKRINNEKAQVIVVCVSKGLLAHLCLSYTRWENI